MNPILGFYDSVFLNYSLGLIVGFAIGAVLFGGLLIVSDWLSAKRLEAKLTRDDGKTHGRKGIVSIACCVQHLDGFGPCIRCDYCGGYVRPSDWDEDCRAR